MSDISLNKKKILLILLGGLTLSLNRSPGRYYKIVSRIKKEWGIIKKEKLAKEIRELYKSKLVKTRIGVDGTITLILTEKGKRKALKYNIEKMKIHRQRWDGKWRLVIFDIPERQKQARDALRDKIKQLGFHELQKSVFVYPFDCQNEIQFITEFFQVVPYVRYGLVDWIDNGLHLKSIFNNLISK